MKNLYLFIYHNNSILNIMGWIRYIKSLKSYSVYTFSTHVQLVKVKGGLPCLWKCLLFHFMLRVDLSSETISIHTTFILKMLPLYLISQVLSSELSLAQINSLTTYLQLFHGLLLFLLPSTVLLYIFLTKLLSTSLTVLDSFCCLCYKHTFWVFSQMPTFLYVLLWSRIDILLV